MGLCILYKLLFKYWKTEDSNTLRAYVSSDEYSFSQSLRLWAQGALWSTDRGDTKYDYDEGSIIKIDV